MKKEIPTPILILLLALALLAGGLLLIVNVNEPVEVAAGPNIPGYNLEETENVTPENTNGEHTEETTELPVVTDTRDSQNIKIPKEDGTAYVIPQTLPPLSTTNSTTNSTETAETTKAVKNTINEVSTTANQVAWANNANLEIKREPNSTSPITHNLPNPYDYGAPLVLLVLEQQDDWYQVLTPERPNNDIGWVHKNEVTIKQTNLYIEVDISERKIIVYNDNQIIFKESVTVGKGKTPTPKGLFYVNSIIPTSQRGYAPAAFGLSGHSEVLTSFGGGDGRFALHGGGDSTVGSAASNGCVRLQSKTAEKFLKFIELGTPVNIHA